MRNHLIHTMLVFLAAVTTCGTSVPVFADADPAPTATEVLSVMGQLKEERCLYNPHAKGCDRLGHFDKGPDAKRIAAAIAGAADGSLTGERRLDAALMATFSSYESGNKADAVGDSGKAHGCFQMHYIDADDAFDPARAAPLWRSLAVSSMKMGACATNPPDERLAGIAGSCVYPPARVKVRQRVQAARDALAAAGAAD